MLTNSNKSDTIKLPIPHSDAILYNYSNKSYIYKYIETNISESFNKIYKILGYILNSTQYFKYDKSNPKLSRNYIDIYIMKYKLLDIFKTEEYNTVTSPTLSPILTTPILTTPILTSPILTYNKNILGYLQEIIKLFIYLNDNISIKPYFFFKKIGIEYNLIQLNIDKYIDLNLKMLTEVDRLNNASETQLSLQQINEYYDEYPTGNTLVNRYFTNTHILNSNLTDADLTNLVSIYAYIYTYNNKFNKKFNNDIINTIYLQKLDYENYNLFYFTLNLNYYIDLSKYSIEYDETRLMDEELKFYLVVVSFVGNSLSTSTSSNIYNVLDNMLSNYLVHSNSKIPVDLLINYPDIIKILGMRANNIKLKLLQYSTPNKNIEILMYYLHIIKICSDKSTIKFQTKLNKMIDLLRGYARHVIDILDANTKIYSIAKTKLTSNDIYTILLSLSYKYTTKKLKTEFEYILLIVKFLDMYTTTTTTTNTSTNTTSTTASQQKTPYYLFLNEKLYKLLNFIENDNTNKIILKLIEIIFGSIFMTFKSIIGNFKYTQQIEDIQDLQTISLHDHQYTPLDILGSGAFGTVYLAIKNDVWYAVKQIETGSMSQIQNPLEFKKFKTKKLISATKELTYLSKIRKYCSEYLICIYQYFDDDDFFYISMKYNVGYTELSHNIELLNEFPDLLNKVTNNIYKAINLLHSNDISHNDLKPDNILMNASGEIKVIDYGGCTSISEGLTGTYTSFYRYPLLSQAIPDLLSGKISKIPSNIVNKQDYWSLGITIYEILNSTEDFLDTTLVFDHSNFILELDAKVSNFYMKCLRANLLTENESDSGNLVSVTNIKLLLSLDPSEY